MLCVLAEAINGHSIQCQVDDTDNFLQGGKAAAAAVPAAPAYNSAEFKRDLKAPVLQVLRDSIDQLGSQLQSEEQSIASCLQQQIGLAHESLQQKPEPSKAEQEAWDLFVLLRREASLGLNNEPVKSKTHNIAAA